MMTSDGEEGRRNHHEFRPLDKNEDIGRFLAAI